MQSHTDSGEFLYAVLNLPKSATQNEIRERHRALSVIFHPDKQHADTSEEVKETAAKRFLEIQKAYETLSDPFLRTVYDLLGAEGLEIKWSPEYRNLPPDELRDRILHVKHERDRTRLESLINPRGRLTFGIDASPLFSREDYWQRQSLLKRIRSVGVPAFGILHSIERRVNNNTTISVNARMNHDITRTRAPLGNVFGVIRHAYSPNWSFEGSYGLFRPLYAGAKATYEDANNTVSISTRVSPSSLLSAPPLTVSVARKLYPTSATQGVMELRMGPSTPVFIFNIVVPKPFDWTEESYEPPEDTDILPKPASISGLTRGAYHYSYGASVAGVASALQAEVGLTFAELKLRFTAGMQLTLAGLQWLMSWTWQPSESSVIGANVSVSVEGVILRLELGVLRQRLMVPIALSPHNDHSLALYATVTPTVLLVLGYHFVMKPRRRIQRVAFYRAMRKALREEKQDIHRGSEETTSLLRGTAQKHAEAERRIQGLVITEAFYGPSEDLEEARALAVDVTVALQALVQDSRLYIPGYKTKANMQGFYDPAPGVPKRLRVRYLFRGREHYGEVLDERPVVLPLQEHLVA